MPNSIKTSLVILAVAHEMAVGNMGAEEPAKVGEWYDPGPERAWLQPYDPTILSRRLLTQFEFEDYEAGDEKAKLLWNLRWAFPIAKDLALGVQVEAPLTWATGAENEDFGLGDIEARAGLVSRIHEQWRAGFGINAKFPTASGSSLGDGRLELRPIGALRWEATTRPELGANLEYTFTPRDEEADRVSAIELKVPIAFRLSESWSTFTSYNPRWDDVSGKWRHRLEVGVTRLFGARRQYALSIGGEFPLRHEPFQWKGLVGLTCYFK